MTITAILGYLIVALFAIGLIGFARIKGIVSKATDFVEAILDTANDTTSLAREVNSKLINELRAGIRVQTKAPTKKKATKKVVPKKKKNP